MLERDYQARLIKDIKELLPGCFVLKNDPNYIQGIPDLIVLHFDRWCFVEVKKSADEDYQHNQEYYLAKGHSMTGASFTAYPENHKDTLHGLQQALQPGRPSRDSVRE